VGRKLAMAGMRPINTFMAELDASGRRRWI
jgi:hypothetical protein